MKKLLLVLAIGSFAACGGGDAAKTTDSTTVVKTDSTKMTTDTSKMAVDSSKMMKDTSKMAKDSTKK
jgi:hypothetical protein